MSMFGNPEDIIAELADEITKLQAENAELKAKLAAAYAVAYGGKQEVDDE